MPPELPWNDLLTDLDTAFAAIEARQVITSLQITAADRANVRNLIAMISEWKETGSIPGDFESTARSAIDLFAPNDSTPSGHSNHA